MEELWYLENHPAILEGPVITGWLYHSAIREIVEFTDRTNGKYEGANVLVEEPTEVPAEGLVDELAEAQVEKPGPAPTVRTGRVPAPKS